MNRIEPNLPPSAFKTYEIRSPLATHFREGTCAEADCGAYEHGWRSTIDESTQLGQQQAHYIRRESGRGFTEERLESGLTRFEFAPGQKCFGTHQVRVDRPEHYLVSSGDWRAPGPRRQHSRAQDWLEDFGEHQQMVADQRERG